MTASAMQQMFRLKYDATVFVIALLPLQQYQHAASYTGSRCSSCHSFCGLENLGMNLLQAVNLLATWLLDRCQTAVIHSL